MPKTLAPPEKKTTELRTTEPLLFKRAFEMPFSRFFEDLLDRRLFEEREFMFWPVLDVSEDESSYSISVELPGLEKKDVRITYENGVLSISGEKAWEQEKKDKNWHRVERKFGNFHRSITLPVDVDFEACEAHLDNGVLGIRLPKTEEAKPRRIEIR